MIAFNRLSYYEADPRALAISILLDHPITAIIIHIVYTGCITKIRTNFNLNFPLYCASARRCCCDVQESLILLVNSYILKAAMLKPSAEYNRRATIKSLRVRRSAMKIIRFFGYPRSTVYDVVAKYTALEKSNEGSSEEELLEIMHREDPRN